jgi:hypothetical protein
MFASWLQRNDPDTPNTMSIMARDIVHMQMRVYVTKRPGSKSDGVKADVK